MSILIKKMEMPTSCAVCGWGSYVGNGKAMCLKTGITEKTDIMNNRRPEWCPLIEVKSPHGRLIDADALIKELKECMYVANNNWEYEMVTGYSNAIESVEEACTIIESEGSDT